MTSRPCHALFTQACILVVAVRVPSTAILGRIGPGALAEIGIRRGSQFIPEDPSEKADELSRIVGLGCWLIHIERITPMHRIVYKR